MKRLRTTTSAGLMSLLMTAGTSAQPVPLPSTPPPAEATTPPAPIYTINLKSRQACATPHARNLARADGGFIDVATPTPNNVTITMTGTTAANSYLGCTGSATETFHLVQEFEITCSDPDVRTTVLTLDSALAGFVRSKGRAGACMRRAEVSVTPLDPPGPPLALAYPPLCVEGTHGQLCNQHLPPIEGPVMPLGRYTLVATFVLDTRASGVCNSHAVADFSPDTTLPADWVRVRDPFQGVSKKAFGFTFSVSAAAPSERPALPGGIRERPAIPLEEPPRPSPPADRVPRRPGDEPSAPDPTTAMMNSDQSSIRRIMSRGGQTRAR